MILHYIILCDQSTRFFCHGFLFFLQVCLGEGAKEESNVVEVTAMNHQGKTISVPIANLHISCLPMVQSPHRLNLQHVTWIVPTMCVSINLHQPFFSAGESGRVWAESPSDHQAEGWDRTGYSQRLTPHRLLLIYLHLTEIYLKLVFFYYGGW